jgi:phospholipase/carboxylesterase
VVPEEIEAEAFAREIRARPPVLPDTAFVSPHAPDPCDGAPYGRQWFPLASIEPHLLYAATTEAAPVLDAFLDAELARHGLTAKDLALVGFSQGTMMALHVAFRRKAPIAGVVGYSGLLSGPEHLPADIRSKPPVILVHGDMDQVVPAMAMNAAVRALERVDVPVEWHLRPGLPHGIDGEGLRLGAGFLLRLLGPAAPGRS